MQPAEITLSDDGIELKGSGWNQWNYVSSCWTILKVDIENHVDREYLIIKLKDNTELKCLISELDKSGEEIIDLLRKFKPDVIFNGLRNN